MIRYTQLLQTVLITILFLSYNLHAQKRVDDRDRYYEKARQRCYFLINSTNPRKKVKIKNRINYQLVYSEKVSDSIKFITHTITGTIDTLSNTTLSFKIDEESISFERYNGLTSETYNDYSGTNYYTNDNLRTIDLSTVEKINYSSPGRDNLSTFFAITTFVSAIAILGAPLLSINYKNGTFNSERYYHVAGYGLIGFAVSIPLMAITDNKTYHLKNTEDSRGKNLWYLTNYTENKGFQP